MTEANSVPNHVAVVPDGNRRFAKKSGMLAFQGHRAGADVFKNFLDWSREFGIREVSFWGLSMENLKRDKAELAYLFKLFEELCDEVIKKDSKAEKYHVRVRFCGELHLLPKSLQDKMRKAEEVTKNNSDYAINFLLAYGGREEILHAARQLSMECMEGKLKPGEIDAETFRRHLYMGSYPDLVIRTGHACLSGLLPWQSTYSEIIFLDDKFWPEFTKADLKSCLDEYSRRRRSFGK
jgi:tritrans,polycis-undecaprenyl-diphosphate synthase [geranylgeranyl-diphosphate specific]